MFDVQDRLRSRLLLIPAAICILTTSNWAQVATPQGSPAPAYITPERLSASFAEVAKKVGSAVVSIDTKGKAPDLTTRGESAPGDPDDIMDFFRRQMPRRPSYSVGSGFFVDKTGHVLTNYHVVEDAAKITVKTDSGEEYPAQVVGFDDETDLAVLKVDVDREVPFVKLADSDKARVGDWVLAIGSPFGLNRSVTAGIISQTNRETPSTSVFQRFIQTDAAINRGNSGGPLANMNGDVIGINSQIATSTGDYNGVGFALPSNEAAYVFDQILKSGKVRRGYLGVGLETVKTEFAAVYGLKEAKGAIVVEIKDGKTGAGAAGLKIGDVIVEFNGQKIDGAPDLIAKVSAASPENSINVAYLRENGSGLDKRTATIRLGERPIKPDKTGDEGSRTKLPLDKNSKEDVKPFGLTLVDLTQSLALTHKLEGQKGVLVKEINPESFIADVKLSNGVEALGEGDLIQRMNRAAVTDVKSFSEAVGKLKKGDAVVLHVLTYDARTRSLQFKVVQFTVQ
ncbi:MAG TPA: trypsin-like peptidase domain-containing protein [Pyrinomonadaceae bacterium]|nr:trypsin-like peptidase domain-containing protein [Pyrinomonadaceae bacterium]